MFVRILIALKEKKPLQKTNNKDKLTSMIYNA